jgi:hypothetical protein
MKKPSLVSTIMVGVSLLASACVSITSANPKFGLPGSVIEIKGNGFSPVWYENQVTIGGKRVRVIEASATRLRVVALRDLASGRVRVVTPSRTITSRFVFQRRGDTLGPTPERDSGPELIEGRGYPRDRRYDMHAQGTGQKVLVVLAKPADIDPEMKIPGWANLEVGPFANAKEYILRLTTHPDRGVNRYWADATYGKISGDFFVTDWMPLSQPWDFYAWGPDDVTRAQNSVNGAQADLDSVNANPSSTQADIDAATALLNTKKAALKQAQDSQGFLQQPDFAFAEALIGAKNALGASFDDYADHFLVLGGPWMRGSCCWNGTGFHAESANPMLNIGPFDIDFPAPRGGTWMGEDGKPGRMAHELSHFFASGDLYDGSAGAFDLMGFHDDRPLYSGYNQHLRGDWIDQSMNGNVVKLQWGSQPEFDQTFELVAHGKTEDPIGNAAQEIVKLRVTDGLFYFVEVRQNPDPTAGAAADYAFDPSAPAGEPAVHAGVLITKAVEGNNQSNNQEPMITLVPPEATPNPRSLAVGEVFTDPARTIRISVVSRTNDRPARYNVRVEWGHLPAADPNGQFDLRITPWGAPPYETPDIWANSTKNDTTAPPQINYQNHEPGDETKPIGNGDPPWVNHDNTLFARISNQGMVETPEDVRVTFYVNTPPGIGDSGTWAPFDTVVVGHLGPNETRVIQAARPWRPSVGEHTCVKVQIEPMTGEVTFDNNQAQENFSDFEAAGSSPYKAVELDVMARNPYDQGIAMDLMARNVPKDWYVALNHGAVYLPPKGEKRIHAVIWTDRVPEWNSDHQPPKDQGPPKALINLEGWVGRPFDRMYPVGGVTALARAVRNVDLHIATREKEFKREEHGTVIGQLAPAVASTPIVLHLTQPDGRLIVERTVTNGSGQFVYRFSTPFGGAGVYRVQAFVLAGSEASEAESNVLEVHVD